MKAIVDTGEVPGIPNAFIRSGFREVARRSPGRPIMRIELRAEKFGVLLHSRFHKAGSSGLRFDRDSILCWRFGWRTKYRTRKRCWGRYAHLSSREDDARRKAIESIYRQYLDIGFQYGPPRCRSSAKQPDLQRPWPPPANLISSVLLRALKARSLTEHL